MWPEINKPRSTSSLRFDGLIRVTKKNHGRKRLISDDEDESDNNMPSRKQSNNQGKVQQIVDSLKMMHESNFTFLQMLIWVELIASCLYSITDDPPHINSMLERAVSGGSSTTNQKDCCHKSDC